MTTSPSIYRTVNHRIGIGCARRAAVLAVAALVAVAIARPARAEPKDPAARERLEQGQAALARDDYEAALAHYEEALAIEREPKVLYLLGQVEFLRGRCRESVRYFTQVKEFEVGAGVEEAMRPYLAECAERLADDSQASVPAAVLQTESSTDDAKTDASSADPSPSGVEAEGQPAERDQSPPARRWYQDPLGDALVAVGVAGAAAGGAMLLVARLRRTGAANYGELEADSGSIQTLRIAGGATLGVGAAVMLGGFVRWGLVARKRASPRSTARVGVLYDGTTTGLSLGGRF